MRRPEAIEKIRKVLKKFAPNATAILYGSEARGEARPDSDFDLLILIDAPSLTPLEENKITFPLYDLELDEGISVSPIVYTKAQWENRPFVTPFYANVMNDGILL